MPLNRKLVIVSLSVAASIRCNHAPNITHPPALPDIQAVTLEQIVRPHEGPSKQEIEQFHLKEFLHAIDSDLMPHADAKTRDRLASIKTILDEVDRDGTAFLKSADNDADFAKALADVMLIAGTMYPDYLDLQLKLPSILMMTAHSLKLLRVVGLSRDVEPDIARYKEEARRSAARTVERFPNVGKAYGQLGVVLSRTGGDEKEMLKLFKRCIDLDSQAEFCKEGYSVTQSKSE